MTSIADFVRSVSALSFLPGAAEAARQQSAAIRRAVELKERRPIDDVAASRIAVFSLGTWAQRFPEQSYDLGLDCAVFLADWLAARAWEPTEDRMHEALEAWRARRWHERVLGPPEQALDSEEIRAALAKLAEAGSSKATPPERVPNRHDRRRERARRWRG